MSSRLSPSSSPLETCVLTNFLFLGNEGYNFADNFRSRAERASMSSASGMPPYPGFPRRRATMPTPPVAEAGSAPAAPVARAPQPKPRNGGLTDPMQERILKGDFYMD